MFRTGRAIASAIDESSENSQNYLRDLPADAALCCHPQLASPSLRQIIWRAVAHQANPLSVYRTFVVQLHAGADDGHCSGRVEHVASGRSAQFSTVQALLEFLSDNNSDEGTSPQPRVR